MCAGLPPPHRQSTESLQERHCRETSGQPHGKVRRPCHNRIPGQLGEVLLIFLVFFVVAGNPAPDVNEPHYLSRLKHFWNPAWCQGDFFLQSMDAQPVFIWTFGWVTRWLSLPATAWLGRVLAWVLLAWSWQRLSWRLVPRPLCAVLSAALWVTLTMRADFAGEWIVGGVEAKCFAYVFVLLGLRDLVDRRWGRLWIWLGAAAALHPVVGAWCVVLCGGVWLVDGRREVALPAMLPGLVAGGLISLAGVVPALRLTWGQPPEVVAEAARIYVFERLPHHLALLSLPGSEIATRFVHLAVLFALLWASEKGVRTVFCPARSFADQPVPTKNSSDPFFALGLVRINRFAWGAVLLAAVGLAIELALWSEPLWAARVLRYYWFRMIDFALPMSIALSSVALVAAGIERRRAWAAWGLVAALLVAGWHLSMTARARLLDPVPPADQRMRDYAAWVDVCEWVVAHTPPDAVFLTPRRSHTFKWRTGRAEVVTHKDIPQDAADIVEWYNRTRAVYYEFDPLEGELVPAWSLGYLGAERVLQAARQYGARYAISDRRELLSLPIVYWNDEYAVYDVGDPDAGPAAADRSPPKSPSPP